MDCGATCLRMIAKHYGKEYSLQEMREKTSVTREGVSFASLSEAAQKIGFQTLPVKVTYEELLEAETPFIAHWKQQHFVVVTNLTKKKITVADPGFGIVNYTPQEFEQHWASSQGQQGKEGLVLLVNVGPEFYEKEENEELEERKKKKGFSYFINYVKPHKQLLLQLTIGLALASLFSLITPFLTQNIVDTGISSRNVPFIYLVLAAQMFITLSSTAITMLQSWVSTHLSTRINVSMISDYIVKLMKLPISFFDAKMSGDIMQRISDYGRIQNLISSQSISVLFSLFNLVILSFVLLSYNPTIYLIFFAGSTCYTLWITIFLKARAKLDFKMNQQLAGNQNVIQELVQGMQEIKLNGCEEEKRWNWEKVQASIFKIKMKGLALSQYQQVGSLFINETKNVLISAFAAISVINGEFTVGTMFAITAIVGQLNAPISSLLGFITSVQDAKLSLERIEEILLKEEEEKDDNQRLPEKADIIFKKVSFKYDKASKKNILQNLNFTIPYGKTTAIVGSSGSGKSTILKLLLKFYDVEEFSGEEGGNIYFGDVPISQISAKDLRRKCSAVMQDSFIFSDTIQRNIAVSDEVTDKNRFMLAVNTAHVQEFVKDFPLGYATKIGGNGKPISGGQRQRITIARAVYKNPDYIFFDEATSALDANSEAIITRNLNQFLKNRTAVVIAHRLSTVKNADQILVLEKGELVEQGTHRELVDKKGRYYELVKNQLELGS